VSAPTPRVFKRGIIAEVVDALTEEHRGRVWIDKDGDIWAKMNESVAWCCWSPGDWEPQNYMTPCTAYGPFTEVRRVDQI
jgi:hypothetical protein